MLATLFSILWDLIDVEMRSIVVTQTSSYIFSAMVFSSGVILLVLIVLLNLFPDQLWTVLVSFFLYGFLIGRELSSLRIILGFAVFQFQ